MSAIVADDEPASPAGARFAPTMSSRRFWLCVGGLWLLVSLVLLALRAHAIAWHDFPDVDDELRLVEVRDWLAGQSFYDVTQYRMNAPFGAPMHWSRLVDLPLALIMVLLRPLLGAAVAETVAAVAVPLLTLGVIMAAAGATARRLTGAGAGLIAAGSCALCIPMIIQVTPLRVDHHGWEIAFQFLALFAAFDRDPRRGACGAALALAVALQISLEPLPFSAAVGAAFGFWWVVAPADAQRIRLSSFVVTLAVAELLLFGMLHAPSVWGTGYCDAVSPPHVLLLGLSAVGVVLVTRIGPRTPASRLIGLCVVALCAVAAYRAYPPHCGLDAFSNLEPIVRKFWYDRVLEGLPFWRLPPVLVSSTIGFPLIGTACAAYAAWRQESDRRATWILYAALLGAATLAAALVQRASGFACVAATPAAAWMISRYVPIARRSGSLLGRVLGPAAICFAFSPIAAVTAVAMLAPPDPDAIQPPAAGVRPCNASENIAGLSALPPSRLLAPLDLGSSILLQTRHAPLASDHHRNHVAMAQVLTAFTGSADTAHAIIRARGIGYVVLCPATSEIGIYRREAPAGFAADLVAGRVPAWLAPVHVPGDPVRVWRVLG